MAEMAIYEHHGPCPATLHPPPTQILPLPTRNIAPAYPQATTSVRVSGLVSMVTTAIENGFSLARGTLFQFSLVEFYLVAFGT